MRAIDLALKDLMQIFRDWRAAVFLLVMPIAFTLLFGFAFGGFGGSGDEDPRLPVTLINEDQADLSLILEQMLRDSPVINVSLTESEDIEASKEGVNDGDAAAVIIIPEGFSQGIASAQLVPLTLFTNPIDTAGRTIQGEVEAAVKRLQNAADTAVLSEKHVQARGGFSTEADRAEFFDQTLDQALITWEAPPVVVKATATGAPDEESDEGENAFAQTSSGMMAQFAIAGLMGAATILVLERKNRALHRLLTTPMTKVEVLLGHFLAMFIMIAIQLVLLIIFGQLILNLNYFGSPLALITLVVVTALFSASLGLLIGAVAKTEEQVTVLSLIPMFILAALGGAWVPLEITPEAFQRVAYVTPLAWVVEGFKDITVRGQGIEAVLPAALVLLGYTAVLLALAVWRFRFD